MSNIIEIVRGMALSLTLTRTDDDGPIDLTGGEWEILQSSLTITEDDFEIADAAAGVSTLYVGTSRTVNFKSGKHAFRAICKLPSDAGIPTDSLIFEVT